MGKGEVTAYFALVFLLLLSFVTSIMDAASIQLAKNYRRADMNRAVECIFAEYQKELLDEFGILGLDGSYESGSYSEQQILDRFVFYGGSGSDTEIRRIQLLTDNHGKAFYEQAVTYLKQTKGIDHLESFLGITNTWSEQEEKSKSYEEEERNTGQELNQMLAEEETALPEEGNPISQIEAVKQGGLLELVMPKGKDVSGKSVSGKELFSNRTANTGRGEFPEFEKESGTMSDLLFGEYLLELFNCAVSDEEGAGLSYELEYILYGAESDRENLEKAVRKLLLFRFVPNYAYLQSDAQKKAEAETLALALSTLAAMPAAQGVVTQAILLAWAFGESIADIRSLLKGSKVPLVKSEDSWQLSLEGLGRLGTDEDTAENADQQNGLSYQEYLRILLFLAGKDRIIVKSMDIAELRLRSEKGLSWFRIDACVSCIDITVKANLRRGITYQYPVSYGYR